MLELLPANQLCRIVRVLPTGSSTLLASGLEGVRVHFHVTMSSLDVVLERDPGCEAYHVNALVCVAGLPIITLAWLYKTASMPALMPSVAAH